MLAKTMDDAKAVKKEKEKEIKKIDRQIKRDTLIYLSNELKSMQDFMSNLGSMIVGAAIPALLGGVVGGLTGVSTVGQGMLGGFLTSPTGRTVLAGTVAGAGVGAGLGILGPGGGVAAGVEGLFEGGKLGFWGGVGLGVGSQFGEPEIKALRDMIRNSVSPK